MCAGSPCAQTALWYHISDTNPGFGATPKSAWSLDCNSLKNLTIRHSVTYIPNSARAAVLWAWRSQLLWWRLAADLYCCSLVKVRIPDSVTSIGDASLCHCASLLNLSMSNCATCIPVWPFFACTSLQTLMVPNTVTHIGGQRCPKSMAHQRPTSRANGLIDIDLVKCRRRVDIDIPGYWNNLRMNVIRWTNLSGLGRRSLPVIDLCHWQGVQGRNRNLSNQIWTSWWACDIAW